MGNIFKNMKEKLTEGRNKKNIERKMGIQAIEMAIMLVVVLAVCLIFKDQIATVATTICEYVSTKATTMFSI